MAGVLMQSFLDLIQVSTIDELKDPHRSMLIELTNKVIVYLSMI